jgi:GNAT superfamily N-acetyltransferase
MIRQATADDIQSLVVLGKIMHDETSYKHVEYAPEKVAKTCQLMITNGFLMVAEKDGEVVGVMMGDVVTPWYTDERMGIDYCLYIYPEHRNGLIAVRLIKKFEEWCIAMGATQIRPGVGTGDKNVSRLYKSLGFNSVGEWFLKDI